MNNQEKLKNKIKKLNIIFWLGILVTIGLLAICVYCIPKDMATFFSIAIIVFAVLSLTSVKIVIKNTRIKIETLDTITQAIQDSKKETKEEKSYNKIEEKTYNKKYALTDYEKRFFTIINNQFGQKYLIQMQIPLSSIVSKKKDFNTQYANELYRTIDIGIFDKTTFEPILMIEINDQTHQQKNRHERDIKVRNILQEADIPLITFYSEYPNNAEYIINRIKENLPRE